MMDFLNDNEFKKLEKEFKFLSRARDSIQSRNGELEKLSYVVLDLETTGLKPETEEIIEVGAIKIEGGEIKDIYNRLVKATKNITQQITDLTGITQEMVENELPIKPVISKFRTFCGDNILVAHNADFDISFLKVNYKEHLNQDISNFVVCTLLIARDILPNLENHKLHTIAKYFHIDVANRHRAIGDAELTYQVWFKLIEKLKERKILTRKDLEDYMAGLTKPKMNVAHF